jgi:predicted neutral ceramidase superfamily lipid hydrolase
MNSHDFQQNRINKLEKEVLESHGISLFMEFIMISLMYVASYIIFLIGYFLSRTLIFFPLLLTFFVLGVFVCQLFDYIFEIFRWKKSLKRKNKNGIQSSKTKRS